jgi:hypothetical protein
VLAIVSFLSGRGGRDSVDDVGAVMYILEGSLSECRVSIVPNESDVRAVIRRKEWEWIVQCRDSIIDWQRA